MARELMGGLLLAALLAGAAAAATATDAASAATEADERAAAPTGDAAQTSDADELDATIAEILAGPAADGADATATCVPRSRIRRTEVLSERHVAFHMRGGAKYLVQFRRRCAGLRRNRPIRVEARSFQLCAMDSIQGSWDLGYGGTWGPRCLIPGFEPVSPEQLQFIEEALLAGDMR